MAFGRAIDIGEEGKNDESQLLFFIRAFGRGGEREKMTFLLPLIELVGKKRGRG